MESEDSLPYICTAYKNPLLDPVLGQVNPVHTFTPYFSEINFNIVFLEAYVTLKWYYLLRFPE